VSGERPQLRQVGGPGLSRDQVAKMVEARR
jgi:hypothetical protein